MSFIASLVISNIKHQETDDRKFLVPIRVTKKVRAGIYFNNPFLPNISKYSSLLRGGSPFHLLFSGSAANLYRS